MSTRPNQLKRSTADLSLLFATRHAIARLHGESKIFLLIGLFFGFFAVTFIPPICTFDGPAHFYRAVGISQGKFRAIRYSERHLGGPIPGRYARFVETLWSDYWPEHRFLKLSEWSALTRVKFGDSNPKIEGWTNTAVYSPANYLPQSLGIALSRMISRSPLWAHRIGCALNVILFLALIAWALEVMPRGRSVLLLLATSPFVLIQAATINIDGINFAVPVCLFVLVWKLRVDHSASGSRQWVVLATLALWLSLLKPPNIVCLGFLFFIPSSCFNGRLRKAAWIAAMLAVVAILWNVWNKPYLDVNVNGWFDPTHPPVREQKAWLLQHPTDFLNSFRTFLIESFPHQWKNFYSDLGDWAPAWVIHLLGCLSYWFLAVLLLVSVQSRLRDRFWGVITLTHAATLLFVMSLALWIVSGVKYTGVIPFLGGRYLFLFYFLASIAWSELVGLHLPKAKRILVVTGLAINIVSLGSVLFSTAIAVAG